MPSTIYAIHAPHDKAKLARVISEMQERGAPEIAVVDCGDHYMALEGSHRLAAADHLGLEPILLIYEQDEIIGISQYDWYEPQNWDGSFYDGSFHIARQVAAELFEPPRAVGYQF